MLNTRISISIVALLVGLAMFFISLVAAAEISFGDDLTMSQRKLYFSEKILPDNLLYPLIAGTDQLRLELASPAKKTVLQLQYAQRRHQSAVDLVAKGENQLALQTFMKSQSYLARATSDAEKIGNSPELQHYLSLTIKDHIAEMKQLRSEMTESEEQSLNSIIVEMEALAH